MLLRGGQHAFDAARCGDSAREVARPADQRGSRRKRGGRQRADCPGRRGLEAATARLNLRGVAALNDNNPSAAREFFLQAYRRDARNAFTLNNLGYVAELAGDRESAEMYYEAARSGRDANARR
jgi:Tfp pilus assembly protein PilF